MLTISGEIDDICEESIRIIITSIHNHLESYLIDNNLVKIIYT